LDTSVRSKSTGPAVAELIREAILCCDHGLADILRRETADRLENEISFDQASDAKDLCNLLGFRRRVVWNV
jgi:hypothetical protein